MLNDERFIERYLCVLISSALAGSNVLHWRIQKIWADAGYRGKLLEGVHHLRQGRGQRRIQLEIAAKSELGKFVLLPKRWIAERTFAWPGWSHRLSKNYEGLCETTETWILIAIIQPMSRRLARH